MTFPDVLTDRIGLLPERLSLSKVHIFLFLTGFGFPAAIYGQAQITDSGPLRKRLEFRVASEVSDQDDFVE